MLFFDHVIETNDYQKVFLEISDNLNDMFFFLNNSCIALKTFHRGVFLCLKFSKFRNVFFHLRVLFFKNFVIVQQYVNISQKFLVHVHLGLISWLFPLMMYKLDARILVYLILFHELLNYALCYNTRSVRATKRDVSILFRTDKNSKRGMSSIIYFLAHCLFILAFHRFKLSGKY